MERIKSLNLYQKCILLLLAVMLAVFTPMYAIVSSREGFEYKDAMFYPSMEGDKTVYTGKMNGKETSFTVAADKAVTFCYDGKTYGPYTVREDPTAIPEDSSLAKYMTGIEILDGENVYFRGGSFTSGGTRMLIDEDENVGTGVNIVIQGVAYDAAGNVVDRMAPRASVILDLAEGPKLVSHGDWTAWFGCLILMVVTVVSILYADEIFQWQLSWKIQNTHDAEPSDWEIFGRYLSWTLTPLMILILYIAGLNS